ncbi:triphosphoribosyl-dephospho-CoA synthase MdcB [Paraburkholderia caballeronis]|uniref:triphosphoribosyl-dephospho-CoA synthase MdcB n=1 Tax=Paraburkholderia caballeronis TaxID=416943 RepID=UPI0010F2A967|nr:triphosphoribosyl-dephospho-CoA synthase MdcB [Paraburkholderia caballeronis]TDV19652.1 triphosphoribosyl-dephospho-CoA synthase [Paraburkholderia caballeronis]TDV22251.1 triphosphoribosyl-dephospho-CoA synthase [Paraburkholderia caballeronis]TDV29155.1 triphosphoribosyl-dephospho-CoA synthase [Paraburkholderia caballeronis]
MNPGASMQIRMPEQPQKHPAQQGRAFARHVARAAIHALYDEVMIAPKPGLVTRIDNGSHRDMDASTFVRSLFSLRHYFAQIARCGQHDAPFAVLQGVGVAAERRMLAATRGVNTHRGAIFNLGLLAAAAGKLHARGVPLNAQAICDTVGRAYGADILASAAAAPPSHGREAAARYGITGARDAAAGGYRVLCQVAVPTLQRYTGAGCPRSVAAVQTLFAVMEVLDDTNVFHRGGRDGMDFVKQASRAFLAAGGVRAPHWHHRAAAVHRAFVERNLSPGGAADMLAAALFVDELRGI